jgi:cytochrome P450
MKRRQVKNEDLSHFDEWQLYAATLDLWLAHKSLINTMRWTIIAMTKYPRIQAKIHEEIDNVIGRERRPTTSNRLNMPYVVATINEVQRTMSAVKLNFGRTHDQDVRIGRYTILKNTQVVQQISTLFLNEKIFPRADEFKPERFLDENTNKLWKNTEFIPFTIGKRQCSGQSWSHMEMFLVFVYLMQRYEFSAVTDGEKLLDSETQDFVCWVKLRDKTD